MAWTGSRGSTPRPSAVPGMICISPIAPAGDTASGWNADSVQATAVEQGRVDAVAGARVVEHRLERPAALLHVAASGSGRSIAMAPVGSDGVGGRADQLGQGAGDRDDPEPPAAANMAPMVPWVMPRRRTTVPVRRRRGRWTGVGGAATVAGRLGERFVDPVGCDGQHPANSSPATRAVAGSVVRTSRRWPSILVVIAAVVIVVGSSVDASTPTSSSAFCAAWAASDGLRGLVAFLEVLERTASTQRTEQFGAQRRADPRGARGGVRRRCSRRRRAAQARWRAAISSDGRGEVPRCALGLVDTVGCGSPSARSASTDRGVAVGERALCRLLVTFREAKDRADAPLRSVSATLGHRCRRTSSPSSRRHRDE